MATLAVSRTPIRGVELGYAEITSNFTTSSTHTTLQDVTGLEVTVTVGHRPIIVETGSYASHSTTGGTTLAIFEGATQKALTNARVGTANYASSLYVRARLAPSAGSHTYKVQFAASNIDAAASLGAAATSPAWIQVTEV